MTTRCCRRSGDFDSRFVQSARDMPLLFIELSEFATAALRNIALRMRESPQPASTYPTIIGTKIRYEYCGMICEAWFVDSEDRYNEEV